MPIAKVKFAPTHRMLVTVAGMKELYAQSRDLVRLRMPADMVPYADAPERMVKWANDRELFVVERADGERFHVRIEEIVGL